MNIKSRHWQIAIFLCISMIGVTAFSSVFATGAGQKGREIHGVFSSMTKGEFSKIYPKEKARTYRQDQDSEWITFNEPLAGNTVGVLSFQIQNGKIKEWRFNDRSEVIEEYLSEFCSQAILHGMPKMNVAIREVLEKIPFKDFLKVTDRRRPVLFTEYYDSGTAQFANSSEIVVLEDDAPAFEGGLTIIKLSTALNGAETSQAIKGVVAHELAHRILEHSRKGLRSCASEREANALIKRWGLSQEYQEASKVFGHEQAGGSAPCQEK